MLLVVCLALASIVVAEDVDYHARPKYSFEYGVDDPHTKDVKMHWETRDGDKVEGSYSVREADGTVRIVDYSASDGDGFSAVVRRKGHAVHPRVAIRDQSIRQHQHQHQHQPQHQPQHETPQVPIQIVSSTRDILPQVV